jgi:hypothetical protein
MRCPVDYREQARTHWIASGHSIRELTEQNFRNAPVAQRTYFGTFH